MITKTSLLASTVTPEIRGYIDASIKEVEEAHSRELKSLQQSSDAKHNQLLEEISIVRASLNTVNGIIENDPSHRITKASLIRIAKELGL